MTIPSQRRDGEMKLVRIGVGGAEKPLNAGRGRRKDAEMARCRERESGVEGGSSTSTRHNTVQVAILVAA